jgi:hypothetical protein
MYAWIISPHSQQQQSNVKKEFSNPDLQLQGLATGEWSSNPLVLALLLDTEGGVNRSEMKTATAFLHPTALYLQPHWPPLILSGRKTVELRSSPLTNKLEGAADEGKWLVVGLVAKEKMYGVARFVGSQLLDKAQWTATEMQHKAALDTLHGEDRPKWSTCNWYHAWSIIDVLRFTTPVPLQRYAQTEFIPRGSQGQQQNGCD